MTYMSVNREQLIHDLRDCVAEISFQKKDGTNTKRNVTLIPSYLPEEYRGKIQEEVNKDGNPDLLSVWDVGKPGWISFRLDWITSIQQKDSV